MCGIQREVQAQVHHILPQFTAVMILKKNNNLIEADRQASNTNLCVNKVLLYIFTNKNTRVISFNDYIVINNSHFAN